MARYITHTATLACIHGGRVILPGATLSKLIQGNVPLVTADLIGAPIVGCPVAPTPASKPCLQVLSLTTGIGPTWLMADGQMLLLEHAEGMTDGVPAATWRVFDPGQFFIDIAEA